MMLDKQNTFSDKQDLAQTAATYLSTNSLDLGVPGVDGLGNTVIADVGRSRNIELLVQVTETFTSSGSATVQFQLIESANANLSSPDVLATTPAIAYTALKAGYQARLGWPAGFTKRYIGVQYVIGTATTTAGKVTAALVETRQTNPSVA